MRIPAKIALATITCLSSFVFFSCGDAPIEHGTEYVLMAPDGTDTVDVGKTRDVLANRLNNVGVNGDFEISMDGNKIIVRVREGAVEDPERMRKLLQSSAGLTFRATYNAVELLGAFTAAHETWLRMNHIDSANRATAGFAAYFIMTDDPAGPVMAYCLPKDTAAVAAILRVDSIAMLFPPDLVFHWGNGITTEDGRTTLGLFACKAGRNHEVSGERVAEAEKQFNQQSGSASPEISIQFDATGTDEWAKLSKANMGRSIAIEVDDFVYSHPNVMGEITGGAATMTGNFTEQEADELVAVLKAGKMPTRVQIVEEKPF